jgi:heme-degrading monooxygenase HmoA
MNIHPMFYQPKHHLAQVNIARARYALDDARMEGFVSRLKEINTLAESSPGFVWRYKEDVDAGDSVVFNLSVWESVDALREFSYGSAHKELFRSRHQWFERMEMPSLAMWWIKAGVLPTPDNAKARLNYIRDFGETDFAFTFRNLFPSPDIEGARAQRA